MHDFTSTFPFPSDLLNLYSGDWTVFQNRRFSSSAFAALGPAVLDFSRPCPLRDPEDHVRGLGSHLELAEPTGAVSAALPDLKKPHFPATELLRAKLLQPCA